MELKFATPVTNLPPFGFPLDGGFFAGLLRSTEGVFALIVSPKEAGEHMSVWGEYGTDISEANSYHNGMANTAALAAAGSPIGVWANSLRIADREDWYIPSRDELELMYRNLKPTEDENYCSFRDGDNPSSIPTGYPYTEKSPAQTAVEAFRAGGAEAFESQWYWASTQYSADDAWGQYFANGDQHNGIKGYKARVRAVRRLLVIE